MMDDNDAKRESDWRELARSVITRLAECKPLKTGNVTALPKLPTQDEIDAYMTRFRALSAAGGWTMRPRERRRRWWWPF